MADINQEIEFYETLRKDLESKYLGKWALIYSQKLIHIYDNFETTAEEAVKLFGRGPYLIRQIGAPPIVLPASVAFIIGHNA